MSPVSWQTKKTVSFFFLLLAMLDHYLKENARPFVRIRCRGSLHGYGNPKV